MIVVEDHRPAADAVEPQPRLPCSSTGLGSRRRRWPSPPPRKAPRRNGDMTSIVVVSVKKYEIRRPRPPTGDPVSTAVQACSEVAARAARPAGAPGTLTDFPRGRLRAGGARHQRHLGARRNPPPSAVEAIVCCSGGALPALAGAVRLGFRIRATQPSPAVQQLSGRRCNGKQCAISGATVPNARSRRYYRIVRGLRYGRSSSPSGFLAVSIPPPVRGPDSAPIRQAAVRHSLSAGRPGLLLVYGGGAVSALMELVANAALDSGGRSSALTPAGAQASRALMKPCAGTA